MPDRDAPFTRREAAALDEVDEQRARAEAAEAAADQLRYERWLLGASRMVLDLVAAGDETRWEQARREAADMAQRIVDEIGHPVTDEPPLGPGFREQIANLREDIAAGPGFSRRAQDVHDALVAAKPGDVFAFDQRPGQRVLVVVAAAYGVGDITEATNAAPPAGGQPVDLWFGIRPPSTSSGS